jgi:hypothetical protein
MERNTMMNSKTLGFVARVVLPMLALLPTCAVTQERTSNRSRINVYKQNFNSLSTGPTQPFPGAPGQGGWFSSLAPAPAYAEIETNIARGRKALHQFTSSAVEGPVQKIDERLITPPDLSRYPRITLQGSFYAHSSDLTAANIYTATLKARGGPPPSFDILGFLVFSGNGTPKETAGVNIIVERFNGVDNNLRLNPAVGQNLAWNAWHTVTLVVDQAKDRYVSIEVDGKSEDLSAYLLPRSQTSPGVWERGQLMEKVEAAIYPNEDFGGSSDDDIYWDNLRITVKRPR